MLNGNIRVVVLPPPSSHHRHIHQRQVLETATPSSSRMRPGGGGGGDNGNGGTGSGTRELVARWRVPMHGKVYEIEFEHGTTSGKRVLWIDKEEIFRRDWMFKLVGEDMFKLEDKRCIIRVDPLPGFKYSYSLFVDGKSYEQFTESQAKALKTWEVNLGDNFYRIVLEKNTLNIYVNGKLIEENGEFVEGGTDNTFIEDGNTFVLRARASGNKREGIVHSLVVNGAVVGDSADSDNSATDANDDE
ncbi:fas apoptotic inhibitory molecule 1 [Uranotaenia lowii]|uniref:fas apoptotic inhibitory molecule 1 n=1 Tax=Uranotaenia lowii TaxID=190385 RepID=UPI00247AA2D0|nr:fas apoptotic inhibitory molecule 1 [Uranotaenia lowii]XP_055600179.1 fas apoptotic inhibitory molecule 1 [Uranotaenia lowii]XP_055600180.1 fas apoptotic inhibitory molecule 1 [Uranotaenia lowii]XP_055600181.1 fas apoptotic inhibitory molecule 1 [Uranotaenia lowii]XP_055600182.1 fas apoptotic inhibitory molecule 1 [Uranotaenia lowii]